MAARLPTLSLPMSEPQRPINTFHAFCSLLLPGLGQLLQKRPGTAFAFCVLFLLTGFLPVHIVSLLFMDRFSQETLQINILHILVFIGIMFPLMLAFFWAIMDAAAWKPSGRPKGKVKLLPIILSILFAGLLVAFLLPAVPSSRESARRMQCFNHLKGIGIAFHNYHDRHGHFPPAYTVDEDGKPLHSWRVLILPYIEQKTLYKQIRLDEPWDSEYNQQFHSEIPSTFRCPSNSEKACCYSVIVGEQAAFNGSQTRKREDFTDGCGNTIFVAERRIPVNWMDPSREISFETACEGVNVNGLGISSPHSGVHVLFGDSRVQFLPNTDKLRKMLTFNAEAEK